MFRKLIRYVKKKTRRFINQRHISDYANTTKGWVKYAYNPVLGDESTGTMFDPFVRIVNNEYIMCVSRRKDDSLMLYRSADGISWNDGRVILKGRKNSQWESSVNRGCFLLKDGKWYLWYTGQHNGKSWIGLAKSSNGMDFERVSDKPILCAEYDFEGISVMNPCVLWDSEMQCFRMWYAAGENYEPDVICYAESKDGEVWKKHMQPVIKADINTLYKSYKVGSCDVLQYNSRLYMAYIVYQNLDVARVSIAKSEDGGFTWEDLGSPILGPKKGEWDGHAVYKPTLCIDKESKGIMLWYNGRYRKTERIGMAYKEFKGED